MSATPSAITAPDGGYGWVIVFSSFFIHLMCNGLTLAMGVLCVSWFQEFNSSKTETSWVVSVTVAVMLGMGPFASSLATKIGYRAMAITGACVITLGSLLSSMASSIQMLMLTLGVIGGIGAGMVYLPAVAVPAFYFEKRRSLAMGLGTAGIGGGMFLLAPVINWLIQYYGWRGTMLVLAGFSLNLCVAGALMRPLDARRKPRRQSILVKYPNSEATSDTESLVQSYREDDPMRELKMKLGRIILDSNSDSDVTSNKSSQEMSKRKAGMRGSDNDNVFVKSGTPSVGSHCSGSEPVLPITTELMPYEDERMSPKLPIPAIVIDPFPAIDKPDFESEIGSRKNSSESDKLVPNQQENNMSNINSPRKITSDTCDSKALSQLMMDERGPESLEIEQSSICIKNPGISLDANGNLPDTDYNVPLSCYTASDSQQKPELSSINLTHETDIKEPTNESDVKKDVSIEPNCNNILSANTTKDQKETTAKSKTDIRLEQPTHSKSDSTLSLQTNFKPCCNCGYVQRPQDSIPTNSSTIIVYSTLDSKNIPRQIKTHNHKFEPSQNHRNSVSGSANFAKPYSNKVVDTLSLTNEDHKNNNHFSPNGGVSNRNPNYSSHQNIPMISPSMSAAHLMPANNFPVRSTSLHSSVASIDMKPTLAPNILLNDTPMGGSMTVLQSEATFPLTASTDVEACKQFRSLLGLDLGNVYQQPNKRSTSSFLNSKDVKGTGSILTLMTLDRSLSQSKRALSRGSHDHFRSRQTLYGSYRDSIRSRHGSFIRSKGQPRVPVTTKIWEAILEQLRLFQDTTFLLFALSNFLANLSFIMPTVFMVDRAVSLGLGNDFASLLVSLNGAGTIGGRVAIAAIADHPRMNRLVAFMSVLVMAGALTCVSPIFGTSMLLHGIYACAFGILLGNYGALCPCVMVDLKGLDGVGESYGMLLMFMGISNLIGAPIGGFLYDVCGSFSPPFVVHGLFLIGSGVIVLPLLCKKNIK